MARVKGPLIVAAVTAALLSPVLSYPFLNWDDQDVFVRNDALRAAGVAAWAFTTRYMEHYQPLAWLAWGSTGATPAVAHALNLILHAACAVLVFVLARAGLKTGPGLDGRTGRRWGGPWPDAAAACAALFWAIHPLRVEVVAWASAMPYALALLFALLATIAWLAGRGWTAITLFALSLLARPIAIGLAIVFLAMGPPVGPAKAGAHRKTPAGPALAGPLLAIAFAIIESSARLTATVAEVGIGSRLTLAATAPFVYLRRTVWPLGLTPLDPLSLTPRTDVTLVIAGFVTLAAVGAAAWRWRREQPVVALSWLAYVALLAPAMGLVPSGLQATADRYTYLAAVPVSIAMAVAVTAGAGAVSSARSVVFARGAAASAAAAILVALAAATWTQLRYWRDSVTLWTRAVEIDGRNDVALYNLAAALDESGRTGEAIARYEQVLAIVPDHDAARRNRDRLRARTLEDEANRLAASGSLDAAAARYAEAVRLDDRRAHSHAALGVALTRLGRTAEARAHLQAALDQGVTGAAVFNALAYGLMQSGDREGALRVLRDGQRRHPGDPDIARNLAMISRR